MSTTLEQKIAQKEAELARLKDSARKLENGQKIILGGLLMAEAKNNEQIKNWLIQTVEKKITRKADQERITPFIESLKTNGVKTNEENT